MLRLIVTLDGEVVVGLDADIGYVHTGFEKNFEQKTYWKGIPFAPRMDYVAFFANELAYVGAVERLIGIEVPPRAQWIRTLFAELNRIHSHLIYLGTSGVELGAISLFFYCLRERDTVLDLFEMVTGVRMHDRYPQFGGVFEDLPKGFYAEARKFCKRDAQADRRVPRPGRGQRDLARPLPRHRHDRRRHGDRDGPVRPEPARQRRALRPAPGRPVPGLRPAASSTSSPARTATRSTG